MRITLSYPVTPIREVKRYFCSNCLDDLAGKMATLQLMSKKPMTIQEMARLGGKARAKALTPARRSEIAKKAVRAREKRRKAKQK